MNTFLALNHFKLGLLCQWECVNTWYHVNSLDIESATFLPRHLRSQNKLSGNSFVLSIYHESSNVCEVITIQLKTTWLFVINRQKEWILITWRFPLVYSVLASDCAQINTHKERQWNRWHLHCEKIKNNQRNECTAFESDPGILAAMPLNQNKNETKRRKWS